VTAALGGWPKPGYEPVAVKLNEVILKELYVRPGLLAVFLAISVNDFNSTRSLSIWEDQAALRGFMKSKPHFAGTRRGKELIFDWEGTRWECEETTELPTFEESRTPLDAVRGPEPSGFASPES
jgi:heme-degrading monooxygenase HmoA